MKKRSSSIDYSKPTDFQEFKRRFLADQERSRKAGRRGRAGRRERSED